MEWIVGHEKEDLNLLLTRVAINLEFVINLISHHFKMILVESMAQTDVLSKHLGLLEVTMDDLQLANEIL